MDHKDVLTLLALAVTKLNQYSRGGDSYIQMLVTLCILLWHVNSSPERPCSKWCLHEVHKVFNRLEGQHPAVILKTFISWFRCWSSTLQDSGPPGVGLYSPPYGVPFDISRFQRGAYKCPSCWSCKVHIKDDYPTVYAELWRTTRA